LCERACRSFMVVLTSIEVVREVHAETFSKGVDDGFDFFWFHLLERFLYEGFFRITPPKTFYQLLEGSIKFESSIKLI